MKLRAVIKIKYSVIFLLGVLLLNIAFALLYLVYIPKKFNDSVLKYSEMFNVETDLIYAVIRTESNFQPNAVSHSGAIGLMQLMPSTAKFIESSIGEPLDIYDFDDNIRMGVWYLNYLQSKFEGMTEFLAAYNAGEGSVKNWLQDERFSSDGKNLIVIPYAETRIYVKRVKKFYKFYNFLYI